MNLRIADSGLISRNLKLTCLGDVLVLLGLFVKMLRKDIFVLVVHLQQSLRSLEKLNLTHMEVKQHLLRHQRHSELGEDVFRNDWFVCLLRG